jgi:hypothetical protein
LFEVAPGAIIVADSTADSTCTNLRAKKSWRVVYELSKELKALFEFGSVLGG